MRELVTITNATVDISDPASEQTGDLWLAVAQSLDISIDKLKRETAIEEAKGLVGPGGALRPAVAVLKEWIQSGDMSPKRQKRFAESLKESGEPFTMKTLHALLTVAQMEAAREEGGKALSEFKTSLSMEADGVTDGPINALVHMYTGKVNSWYLKTLAKGGWFFDGVTRTRNEQMVVDENDLYEEAAGLFNERLGAYVSGMESSENQENAHRVYRVIDALLKGFSIENWDEKSKAFQIDRKVVKNPLTVMIYGSGKKGVAGKIANEMVGVLYGALSEMVQSGQNWKDHELFRDNPQLADDLSVLFNTFYNSRDKKNQRKDSLKVGTDFLENPEKGGVNKDAFDNMVSHVQAHFASTMFDALDEATGGLTSNMQLAQKASQIQAKVFKDLLLSRIEERRMELTKEGKLRSRKNKDGSIRPIDMLSEEDMRQVFMEVSNMAPIYETEAHEFHIASKEGFDTDKVVSQNFEGKVQGTLVQPTPSEASVKVSPYMTIGTGDGRMILNIYAEDDGTVSASLPVFDGVEIGVDNIRAASTHINKQVFNGWMQDNAFDSMAKGYKQMLSSLDLNKLSDDTIEEIEGILALEEGQTLEEELDRVSEQLERNADIIKARKEAMASVPSRVDHMAGAGASYEHNGTADVSEIDYNEFEDTGDVFEDIGDDESVLTMEEVAALISTRARAVYDRIQAEKETKNKRPTIQAPNKNAQDMMSELGLPVSKPLVRHFVNGVEFIQDALKARLNGKSTRQKSYKVDEGFASEMDDVGALLNLLDIPHEEGKLTEAPSQNEVLATQKRMLEIYKEVSADPGKLEQFRPEMRKLLSWVVSGKGDADRIARAKKSAEMRGNGNPSAHYIIQLVEELNEVMAENNRLNYGGSVSVEQQLGVQKRALKAIRFGGDTFIKQESDEYAGKSNAEAYMESVAKAGAELAGIGTTLPDYPNVRSMPGKTLMLMVTEENGASPEQIRLMNLIRQGGSMGGLDNMTVFVGSAEELNRLKADQYGHLGDDVIEEGQTFVGSQVMFLTNYSPETVLHESLHAATFKATVDYFDNPEAAPQPVREAVERLRVLVAEFMKIQPETQRKNIRESMEALRSDLANPDKSPAQKLSEFISWSLSNQNLIEVGQDTRIRNPLVQVVSGALKMLRKLLGLKTSPGKNLFENVRFNAEILGAFSGKELTARRQSVETDQVLNQVYPGSARLKTIETRFLTRLNSYLEATRPEASNTKGRAEFDKEVEIRRQQARTASETAIANGYGLNPRQGQAYEAMHLALMSGMRLEPSIYSRSTGIVQFIGSFQFTGGSSAARRVRKFW